jgi:hypothetical protein
MNEVREWLTALMTPVIGFLGVWIAIRQHKIQQYALRRDLMSQRLAIFDAVRGLLEDGLKNRLPPIEAVDQFNKATVGAVFLFRPEVTNYLDELRIKYLEVWDISAQQVEEGFECQLEEAAILTRRRELRTWMRTQLLEAKNVFRAHMDLSDA